MQGYDRVVRHCRLVGAGIRGKGSRGESILG